MQTGWSDPVDLIELNSFFISEKYGFVLEKPLTELPHYYQLWMDIANNLTHLIKTHQLRELVEKMPLLSTLRLHGHRQLRLAHLALGFISMGYVWQEGPHQPAKALPKALAVPYCNVSQTLGLPPILVYADCVLANWKLKDPKRNLDTIFSFPGGESGKGFFLVSLLVEKSANSGIQGIISAVNAMATIDMNSLHMALQRIALSIKNMEETFRLMHNHVDPKLFHGTFRIYLSGWRDNPMLPDGLWYEGVSEEPLQLSGGSAAQSSTIQSLDVLLGIQHDKDSAGFLRRMQNYMLPSHRKLMETVASRPSLRSLVLSRSDRSLCQAYNSCVSALVALRSYHLNVVAKYITVPGHRAQAAGCPFRGACMALGDRGTGGSSPMTLLKSVRDSTRKALIPQHMSLAEA
ncbi:indoleamine 2,3-dioxygenase 2-like isoform X2 [Clupea harengus]|uniref:Indoleamine 2,3-dioxygenase 2-like isoform X2 n=1 Tax=Clupea harengus TaxID=7950 RepID=A0A6P3WCJ5_CLUHA|nr:indoleamine 2,3-dioxygenase 2-like isoform X2 [Clupea harengus]